MFSPLQYYQSLPPVAKTYAVVCLITTAASHMKLFNIWTLALFYSDVFRRFQVWRLVTNFFFLGEFSLTFVFRILAIVYYGASLESESFDKRPADYLWMYIFGGSSLLVMAAIPTLWSPFNGPSIVFMILYVWSRENPNARVKIKGLVEIKGLYVPWVTLGIDTIIGHPLLPGIQGILAGHVYFSTVLYPLISRKYHFKTPHWVHDLVAVWEEDDKIDTPVNQDLPDAGVAFRYRSYRLSGSCSSRTTSATPPTSSPPPPQVQATKLSSTKTSTTFRGKIRRLRWHIIKPKF